MGTLSGWNERDKDAAIEGAKSDRAFGDAGDALYCSLCSSESDARDKDDAPEPVLAEITLAEAGTVSASASSVSDSTERSLTLRVGRG